MNNKVMLKRIYLYLSLFAITLCSGCSIHHSVAADYNRYLTNNYRTKTLPKTELHTDYLLSDSTINHLYEFRSVITGYANLWVVEFGEVLKDTLESDYLQDAFGKLEKNKSNHLNAENLIIFTLENYEFKNFRAYISLNISLLHNKNIILKKTYHVEGKAQGGKMVWGGVFAMKNAIQQSTKLALDTILSDFIHDVNNENKKLNIQVLTTKANTPTIKPELKKINSSCIRRMKNTSDYSNSMKEIIENNQGSEYEQQIDTLNNKIEKACSEYDF